MVNINVYRCMCTNGGIAKSNFSFENLHQIKHDRRDAPYVIDTYTHSGETTIRTDQVIISLLPYQSIPSECACMPAKGGYTVHPVPTTFSTKADPNNEYLG